MFQIPRGTRDFTPGEMQKRKHVENSIKKTFEKYVNDRFELMEKTKSNLENIFMIYQDKSREIDKKITKLTEKKKT